MNKIKCFFGFHKHRAAWLKVFKVTGREVGFNYNGFPANDKNHSYSTGKRCDRCGKFKYA